ncbi:hypothetical protein [Francisella frigiditurris]|uniref:Uncharacterized protein n=1 Tax=Francisella frigiditurris TaxID=1542390 RepID=A0A1J0KVI0_9GAMM|nr:hypothetical protein [Francisella frigiditurris]APC97695.1 hypothetical protein KX01_307 [Francisella frigiditurris]
MKKNILNQIHETIFEQTGISVDEKYIEDEIYASLDTSEIAGNIATKVMINYIESKDLNLKNTPANSTEVRKYLEKNSKKDF